MAGEQANLGRPLVYALLAAFVAANLYFMWLADIIHDISEGFSSCERPVIILFDGKNASQLPLSKEQALTQWQSFPSNQPKFLGNQRGIPGFVTILIQVTDSGNKTVIENLNITLQSLASHTWTKDKLEMGIYVVIHTTPSAKHAEEYSQLAIESLIQENIYLINIGFLTIVQLPWTRGENFTRELTSSGSNRTSAINTDHREVFRHNFDILFPYLNKASTHVMFLCPGFVAEMRILPTMHRHLAGVGKSYLGALKVPVGDRWTVLEFALDSVNCPLAGRFLRTKQLSGIYQFMDMFETIETLSSAVRGFSKIKSQYSVYRLDPLLFRELNLQTSTSSESNQTNLHANQSK